MENELRAYFGIFYVIRDLLTGRKKLKDCFTKAPLDIMFLVLVIILLSVGVTMMFSASYVNAMYSKSSNYDPFFYLKKQVFFALIGLTLMIIASHVKPDIFRKSAGLLMLIAVALLIYVLINPHYIPGKSDFKRWIYLPGIGTFQPSEIAKLALIMFFAFCMERYRKINEKSMIMIIPYSLITLFLCALVYKENHVSGTLLMLGIGAVLIFIGGVKISPKWFILGGIAVAVLAVFAFKNADKILDKYAYERIEIWKKLLSGRELTGREARDSGWQSLQSLYAIGSGGLFGLGFGRSKQKHLYLPEPQNDFVFSVACEELGFIGAAIIIVLFVVLVARGFIIGIRAKSRFEAITAIGISFQVGLQAALNIAVVTSTVPNTGISLPFFSYGGTSLVVLLLEMGITLSASRNG